MFGTTHNSCGDTCFWLILKKHNFHKCLYRCMETQERYAVCIEIQWLEYFFSRQLLSCPVVTVSHTPDGQEKFLEDVIAENQIRGVL